MKKSNTELKKSKNETVTPPKPKRKRRSKKDNVHYVNAKEFTQDIENYYNSGKIQTLILLLLTTIVLLLLFLIISLSIYIHTHHFNVLYIFSTYFNMNSNFLSITKRRIDCLFFLFYIIAIYIINELF